MKSELNSTYLSSGQARISFSPTMEQQRTCPGCDATQIDGDFIINYDVNRAQTLGDIQVRLFNSSWNTLFWGFLHMYDQTFWVSSDCERILCPLLCSAWPAQSPKECGVCDRSKRINVRKKDGAGERRCGSNTVTKVVTELIRPKSTPLTVQLLIDTRGIAGHPQRSPWGGLLCSHPVWWRNYFLEGIALQSNQGKCVRSLGLCQRGTRLWKWGIKQVTSKHVMPDWATRYTFYCLFSL